MWYFEHVSFCLWNKFVSLSLAKRLETYQEMDSEEEDSADCQCSSSTPTSKCQGHNCRAVCEPLNRKSLNQLSGSYSAFKRQDEAGGVPLSGHMAFSSPIVSRSCWF